MKKAALLIALLAVPFCAAAESLLGPSYDFMKQGKLKAYYREKYFEYTEYYLSTYDYLALSEQKPAVMASGMINDFGVVYGITDSLCAAVDLKYVFQQVAGVDHNSLQAASLYAQYGLWDAIGIGVGIRMPPGTAVAGTGIFSGSADYDVRLEEAVQVPRAAGWVFADGGVWIFRYYAQASAEYPLMKTGDYPYSYRYGYSVAAGAGIRIYENPEKQSVDFLAGVSSRTVSREIYDSIVDTLVCEFSVRFYDDFKLTLGVESVLDAGDSYLNAPDRILTLGRLSYIINNPPKTRAVNIDTGSNTQNAAMPYGFPQATPSPVTGTAQ